MVVVVAVVVAVEFHNYIIIIVAAPGARRPPIPVRVASQFHGLRFRLGGGITPQSGLLLLNNYI